MAKPTTDAAASALRDALRSVSALLVTLESAAVADPNDEETLLALAAALHKIARPAEVLADTPSVWRAPARAELLAVCRTVAGISRGASRTDVVLAEEPIDIALRVHAFAKTALEGARLNPAYAKAVIEGLSRSLRALHGSFEHVTAADIEDAIVRPGISSVAFAGRVLTAAKPHGFPLPPATEPARWIRRALDDRKQKKPHTKPE